MMKKAQLTIFWLWLPVFVWAGVIFYFSSLPTIQTPFLIWWDVLMKKTAHFVEYLIFFTLIYRALIQTLGQVKPETLQITAMFISLLYAMSDEFHQSFTPGRTPTVRDVVIDFLGILAGLYLMKKLAEKKERFRRIYSLIYGNE